MYQIYFLFRRYATLLSLFNTSIKKGSIKEACLASRAIGLSPIHQFSFHFYLIWCLLKLFLAGVFGLAGLLSITLGAGSSSHEIMVESHPHLSKVLQTWSDASKMISVSESLSCLLTSGFSFVFSVLWSILTCYRPLIAWLSSHLVDRKSVV